MAVKEDRSKPAVPPTDDNPKVGNKVLGKVEWAAAILLTIAAIALRLIFMLHAGPLWRDEVNSIGLVNLPRLSDVWNHLEFDSFPILWFLILRCYVTLGPGQSDIGLRVLGFIFSLLIIGALWWNARRGGYRFPIYSLLLIGISQPLIEWGALNRATGLGIALMLFTFGCMWRVAEDPSRRRIVVATIVAFLGAQCFYYNAVMVIAFSAAGALVALRARGWRGIVPFVVIGAVSLLPLVAYLGAVKRLQSWNMLVHRPVDFTWLVQKVAEVLGAAGQPTFYFWMILASLSIGAAIYCQRPSLKQSLSGPKRDLPLFASTAMVVGSIGYLLFIKQLHYPTHPWYYIELAALIAVSIDATLGSLVQSVPLRIIRLSAILLLSVLTFGQVLSSVEIRESNVDVIAKKLSALATKDDLIVVTPWYMGITFERYYTGTAHWTTLPEISFHAYHRYDLMKEKMSSAHPIDSVLTGIAQTLRSGHRVWIVGSLPSLPPGQLPPTLAPAPQTPYKWEDTVYIEAWRQQAGYFMQTHALHVMLFPKPEVGLVNAYEITGYQMFEGWQAVPGQQRCEVEPTTQ